MNTSFLTITRGLSTHLNAAQERHFEPPKTIRLGTFNMLAPCWKRLDEGREAQEPHLWRTRLERIIGLIQKQSLDVLLIQEFWFQPEYKKRFIQTFEHKYDMFFLQRGNKKPDGLLMLLNINTMPSAKGYIGLDYNDFGSRVAQVLSFSDFRIINTHLTFPHPNRYDPIMRLHQAKQLVDFMNLQPDYFYIVGGDLNGSLQDPAVRALLHTGVLKPMREDSNFRSHFSHNQEYMACDWLLCSSGGRFTDVVVGEINLDISDHAMVHATLNRYYEPS